MNILYIILAVLLFALLCFFLFNMKKQNTVPIIIKLAALKIIGQ